MMYRSQPCLPFFSSVVKNVASPNIEIKKLVYIYILHYAESEPDLALLSINTIQKSLTDQNPQVRAMALRVMSGIRVPVISQIVSLGIKRGCGDMSPYVRKAAALAIPKCYRLDPKTLPQLIEYLSTLLGDKQYYVVGSAVTAFLEVCPDRIDLIHKHYRGIIRKLVDMDEWGQLATLRLMVVYARKCFPRQTRRTNKTGSKGFYGDEGSDEEDLGEEIQVLDPDLLLLLNACKPLLLSRNSAVIVAVVRCYLYLGTPEYIDSAVGPLVALLRSSQDIQHVALYNIISVSLIRPTPFVDYAMHFLVHTSDPPYIWQLKLEILTIIFPYCSSHTKGLILSELEHFSRGSDRELVRESVRAIGRCAQSDNRTSARCLRLLLKHISSPDGNLVAESLTVIRHLIQQDPLSHTQTVIELAKHLDTMTDADARATIIWLVGEFAGIDSQNNIAPDVLRILTKTFADESEAAKLQILLLAAKVYLHHLNATPSSQQSPKPSSPPPPQDATPQPPPTLNNNSPDPPPVPTPSTPQHPIPLLWSHILLLVRYDTSYDLRDRARLYRALLADPAATQLASLLLLAPKPVPHAPSPSESRRQLTLGSASLVVGGDDGATAATGVVGYEPLPEWVVEGREPDRGARDEAGREEYVEGGRGVSAGERLDGALLRQKQEQRQRGMNGGVDGGGDGGGMGVGVGGGEKGKEKGKGKSLDDWLAESDGEEDEDEESEESEESTEDESSGEEESESEEEVKEEDGDEKERLVK